MKSKKDRLPYKKGKHMVNLVPALIIAALAWWYFRRKKSSTAVQARQQPVCIDKEHHVYIRLNSPEEDRIAALHRNATEYKDAKDWDNAIKCLEEANALAPNVTTSYPVKHFLRLPLFLQQGGHFDAAMTEFQRLLNETESRIAAQFSHQNKTTQKMLAHADYAEIHKSISTACKRERKVDLAVEHADKAEKHKVKHAKMFKNSMGKRK